MPVWAALLFTAPQAAAADPPQSGTITHATAAQVFAWADAALDRGDYAAAEAAYRALTADANRDLRNEARFRLAMMLAGAPHRYGDAAVLLRRILDETPRAARVRVELARLDALMGKTAAAARELRSAAAAGLPPQVEQQVRFYAQALDARRSFGGSLALALAPDTNVNRATASPTLNTVLGDFTLSNDAQARSGIGVSGQGQVFARAPLDPRVTLLAQVSGRAALYRATEFDDVIVAPQIGPQIDLGARRRDRLTLAIGPAWRWYGGHPYSFSVGASGDWQHTLGARSQLRIDTGFAQVENRRNARETGALWSLAATFEHAWSARSGGGVQVSGSRQNATDPGYADAGLGATLYVWREIGHTTLSLTSGYTHLEADARLTLFDRRRIDNGVSASLGATFRQVRVGRIAPQLRLRYERALSSVQLYDYRRVSGELGIATAF